MWTISCRQPKWASSVPSRLASKATNRKRPVGWEETRVSSKSKDWAARKQVASPSRSEFPYVTFQGSRDH